MFLVKPIGMLLIDASDLTLPMRAVSRAPFDDFLKNDASLERKRQ
jgi:hypothetical protein